MGLVLFIVMAWWRGGGGGGERNGRASVQLKLTVETVGI
jgi:hypothetical protein